MSESGGAAGVSRTCALRTALKNDSGNHVITRVQATEESTGSGLAMSYTPYITEKSFVLLRYEISLAEHSRSGTHVGGIQKMPLQRT